MQHRVVSLIHQSVRSPRLKARESGSIGFRQNTHHLFKETGK